MYFFTDSAQAKEAQLWGGHFHERNLVEVGVRATSHTTADSNWISYAPRDESGRVDANDIAWIERYWSGDPRDEAPIWETIVHGRATIFGTEVRQRAYDVIARTFPEALDTLEVARVAAAVDSDLGQPFAWITQTVPNTYELAYYMDWRDADNAAFIERVGAYDGPRNYKDLTLHKETFGMPDFRPHGCHFMIEPSNGLRVGMFSAHRTGFSEEDGMVSNYALEQPDER